MTQKYEQKSHLLSRKVARQKCTSVNLGKSISNLYAKKFQPLQNLFLEE